MQPQCATKRNYQTLTVNARFKRSVKRNTPRKETTETFKYMLIQTLSFKRCVYRTLKRQTQVKRAFKSH